MRAVLRRMLALTTAFGLAAGAVAMAAPAQAAQSITVECPTTSVLSLVLEPGEVLTIDSSGCNVMGFGDNLRGVIDYVYNGTPDSVSPGSFGNVYYIDPGSTVTYTAPDSTFPSQFQLSVGYYSSTTGAPNGARQISIAVCDGGVCPVEPAAEPQLWGQAYGRASSDAACQDGWSPSWAWWPNAGTGGFVCERAVTAFG